VSSSRHLAPNLTPAGRAVFDPCGHESETYLASM
jgi:hypothetical protein